MPPKAVVKFGRLTEDTSVLLQDIQQPKVEGNDGTTCQKNYVFFEHAGKLMCIYQCSPEQVIFELQGERVVKAHKSPSLHYPFGEPRGGTMPLPYKGKLLRFFHSGLDNESGVYKRRYYCGAMLLEPEPPFRQIAISKEPVVRGSETDDLSEQERSACSHYKRKVIFPCGAVERDGCFVLSAGVNDASCCLLNVEEGDLKL
jgi:hypothetical protein